MKVHSRICNILRAERVIGFTGTYITQSISAFDYVSPKAFSVLNLECLEKARGEATIDEIYSVPSNKKREEFLQEIAHKYLAFGHVIMIDGDYKGGNFKYQHLHPVDGTYQALSVGPIDNMNY